MALGMEQVPAWLGLPEWTKFPLHEISEIGKFALVLLLASIPIKEVIEEESEKLVDKVEAGFGNLNAVIGEECRKTREEVAAKTGEVIGEVGTGFDRLAAAAERAIPMLKVNVVVPSLSREEADQVLRDQLTVDAMTGAEEEVGILVVSEDEADWEKAVQRMEHERIRRLEFYNMLSFKFWTVANLDRAILVAEAGFALTDAKSDVKQVINLKNNLAYFYAEGKRGDKRTQAYSYVQDIRRQAPEALEFIETEGCVRIAFAETREEALEGLQQVLDAAKAKQDTSTFNRWTGRFSERKF